MKTLLTILTLTLSLSSYAKDKNEINYIYNFASNTRVVLTTRPCNVNGFSGNHAYVIRDDGFKINGCWSFNDKFDKTVKIDWDSPYQKGDYAILNFDSFIEQVK